MLLNGQKLGYTASLFLESMFQVTYKERILIFGGN